MQNWQSQKCYILICITVLFMSGKIHVFLSNFSLFLTKPHSRDAVHDIAGMLLGILKRLKTSCWRIAWKGKIQHELSICPFFPFRFFDFLLGNILGEIWSPFTCHFEKRNWSFKSLNWQALCLKSRSEHFIPFSRIFQSLRHQRLLEVVTI